MYVSWVVLYTSQLHNYGLHKRQLLEFPTHKLSRRESGHVSLALDGLQPLFELHNADAVDKVYPSNFGHEIFPVT